MSWPLQAYFAVCERRVMPFLRGLGTLSAVSILTVLAQACTAPPPPLVGPDPSDPTVRTKAADYRSTIAPYESQRPVEPKAWQQQNQGGAPAPR